MLRATNGLPMGYVRADICLRFASRGGAWRTNPSKFRRECQAKVESFRFHRLKWSENVCREGANKLCQVNVRSWGADLFSFRRGL